MLFARGVASVMAALPCRTCIIVPRSIPRKNAIFEQEIKHLQTYAKSTADHACDAFLQHMELENPVFSGKNPIRDRFG